MPGGRAAVASAGKRSAPSSCSRSRGTEAFSSEVETGSRQENASNQKSRAPFRFHRNGKGSSAPPVALGAMRTLMAGKAHRCGRKRPEANIRSEKSMADTQCETGSLLKHVIASIFSDQPIQ